MPPLKKNNIFHPDKLQFSTLKTKIFHPEKKILKTFSSANHNVERGVRPANFKSKYQTYTLCRTVQFGE